MRNLLKTLFVLTIATVPVAGCGKVDHGLAALDNAINELKQTNKTFDDFKNILAGTKDKLDKGEYKSQIDDLIGRTSQVAQLGVQGSVDFTRTRLLEDLQNLKRSMLGQPLLERVPILSNPQSPKIDYRDTSRSTLTVVGWNLDIAQKAPEKFKANTGK